MGGFDNFHFSSINVTTDTVLTVIVMQIVLLTPSDLGTLAVISMHVALVKTTLGATHDVSAVNQ